MIQQFDWVDYFILGVIVFSAGLSVLRGFVREALSLAIWVAAIWLSFTYASQVGEKMSSLIKTPSLQVIAGFCVLFLAVLIVGMLLSMLMAVFVDKSGFSGTDRLLGVVFGIARGGLLVTVLVMLGASTGLSKDPWWTESVTLPYFETMAGYLETLLPSNVKHVPTLVAVAPQPEE